MKKLIEFAVLMILLIIFSIPLSDTVNAEDRQDLESIQQVIDKRKEFGLPTDISIITSLVNEKSISKEYGVYMSLEEERKFTRRLEELDRVIKEIEEYIHSTSLLKDNYLGLYIDQASGGDIYVGFRGSTSPKISYELTSFSDKFQTELSIYTYEATYSEKEFEDIAQKISDNIYELVKVIPGLKLINPDFINQKIEVGIQNK